MVPVEKGIRRMTKAAGGIFSGKKKGSSRITGEVTFLTKRAPQMAQAFLGWKQTARPRKACPIRGALPPFRHHYPLPMLPVTLRVVGRVPEFSV